MSTRPPLERVQQARTQLIIHQPFFGQLCVRLNVVEANDWVDTCATDGRNLYYNDEFVAKLTLPELTGVVAHEVMHCAFQHMTRRGQREPKLWNIACDFVINTYVLDAGMVLPEIGACIDHKGEFSGMNAEQVYAKLMEKVRKLPAPEWGYVLDHDHKGGQGGEGSGGIDGDGNQKLPVGTGQGDSKLDAQWTAATQVAAEQARAAGNISGKLGELIREATRAKVNWRAHLAEFMTERIDEDYSWRRPHRGWIGEDMYLPSIYSEGLGNIVIAIDTSGSVSSKELGQFWAEITSIVTDTVPQSMTLLHVDSEVCKVEDIDTSDVPPIEKEFAGRGGTRFSPAFKYVMEHDLQPSIFVYLTDMECGDYGETPDYPVMWISTQHQYEEPPFGRVTVMEPDDE